MSGGIGESALLAAAMEGAGAAGGGAALGSGLSLGAAPAMAGMGGGSGLLASAAPAAAGLGVPIGGAAIPTMASMGGGTGLLAGAPSWGMAAPGLAGMFGAKDLLGMGMNMSKQGERGTPARPMMTQQMRQPPNVLPFSSLNPYLRGGRVVY